MSRIALGLTFAFGLATSALADPMPTLPDLPPLPTDYVHVGGHEGPYVGVLGGTSIEDDVTGMLGVVVGNTMMAADLLLGVEVLGLVDAGTDASLEIDLRAGLALTDSVALFAQAGLGASSATGAFASLGSSLDFSFSDDLTLRAQYRYAHDLSSGEGSHAVLAGLILPF